MSHSLQIQILVDNQSWILPYVERLQDLLQADGHQAALIRRQEDISAGDILFILGCVKRVPGDLLKFHQHNIVVHESGLPKGRGNSPLTWQILEGNNEIPACLFEAVEELDRGSIYLRSTIRFKGNELLTDLKHAQGENSLKLCHEFVRAYPGIIAQACPQPAADRNFYRKRVPADSILDPEKTISAQFNLLRVVDNERYPAFFELRGRKYKLKIEYYDERK